MSYSMVLRAIGFAAATVGLGACQYSPDTVDRTLAFNRGVAESTNDLLLLNAVRASRRMPTYYTRLISNTSQGTVAPTLSATIPLRGTKSVALGPTASGTSFVPVTTTLAKAVASIAPGLTATEQNSLTLQNSDDQPSITGMMTPVSMQTFQFFQSEGFNPEEMLLLFMEDARLSSSDVANLRKLADKRCQTVPMDDPRTKWCTDSQAKSVVANCANAFAGSTNSVQIVNDPVLYKAPNDYFEFTCFQSVVRTLLALGMYPDSSTGHSLLYKVPLSVVSGNPRYLSDLNQQGLEIAILPDPAGAASSRGNSKGRADMGYVAVCKKADSVSFHFPKDVTSMPELKSYFPSGLFVIASARTEKSDDTQIKSCKDAATKSPPPELDDAISFDTRSFEAMVYFIGEIIRRKVDLGDTAGTVKILTEGGEDILFDVETGVPPLSAAATAWANERFYYVPSICGPADCKNAEFPAQLSPQVLTVLNQVWGLQKSATTPPAVSSVTVISP